MSAALLLLVVGAQDVDFDRDVRPILVGRCVSCHGPGSANGGLALHERDRATAPLDGGRRALVPGKPEESELLARVRSSDPDLRMPAKGAPLEPREADVLQRWIAAGAPWPVHWAYRPLNRPAPPRFPSDAHERWCRTPVDRFILRGLLDRGLRPSRPADPRTLLRRASIDLTGLPPTPEESDAFLADAAPDAFERAVDRLLASPRYGERWARHWMDLVHFAETHGHDQDRPREHAWPYRDYLIQAFNEDVPYGRFVEEQVAGDVLRPDDPRGIVATGFLAAGPWDESSLRDIRPDSIDRLVGQYLDRDDIVATVLSTFVSTTVHCARCHDHKFDPVSQREYYGLQAVFAGVDKADRPYDLDPAVARRRRELQALLDRGGEADPAEVASWEKTQRPAPLIGRFKLSVTDADPHFGTDELPLPIARILAVAEAERTATQRSQLAAYVFRRGREAELAALPPPARVYCGTPTFKPDGSFKPAGGPRPIRLLKRGDIRRPGQEVPPGALTCVDVPFELSSPSDEGARRAALARWLSHPKNVLAWRSMANRVWQHSVGRGIVDTPNDFGRMGATPSHPELLDWLASELLENGGSIKKLQRLVLTSAVYRQSSAHDDRGAAADAGNRLLWRMNRRRLDAETLRDAILQVSGKLDLASGGPSVRQFVMKPGRHVTPEVDYGRFDADDPANHRRSVYRFLFRTLPDPFMEALDCPDGSQLAPKREASLTALQALAMLHDKFVVRQSEHAAAAVSSPEELFRRVLGRPPDAGEAEAVRRYADRHGRSNLCRVLFNANEFVFVD